MTTPDDRVTPFARPFGRVRPKKELPAPSAPLAVFRALEPDWRTFDPHTKVEVPIRLFWRGDWMTWNGTHWKRTDPLAVQKELYQITEWAKYVQDVKQDTGERVMKSWAPNKSKISHLEHAAQAMLHQPADLDAPAWLLDGVDYGAAVSCSNGILLLDQRQLIAHSPVYFNESSIPTPWTPDATCPRWRRFLSEVWPDDPKSPLLLQEWCGYVLSGRTDMQKIMLMAGVTRSGRGTIGRVLRALLGSPSVAGPSMESFRSAFGLSTLIGKSLAIIPDARLEGRDSSSLVERLLAISGEDTIDIDRKHKDPWTGRLGTRIMMLSNELPRLKDASAAVVGRFLILTTKISFLGREDPHLEDQLMAELPGILNWALEGLDRIDQQRAFTVPDDMADALSAMRESASPLAAFLQETCESGPDLSVCVEALWTEWQQWAERNNQGALSKAEFGRQLRAVQPAVTRRQRRNAVGKRVPSYAGLGFLPDLELCSWCGKALGGFANHVDCK
ncbi:phage/plasmid primase, P4 family [Nocardiopsis dassonvillei]|uniref:DNA primase family protein n=1 Tax=Nocardiopsis dassonvillei TaxID=2014 RepID=UPI0034091004